MIGRLIGLILLPLGLFGQQNYLPIHTHYKDQLFAPRANTSFTQSSFLPTTETAYPLHQILRDSSKQYYLLTQKLFKEHLFEIKGEGYSINISPLMDIARGKDYEDTNVRSLFNNTRGVLIEVDLLDKLSLSTSYYENQNRFSRYESAYYASVGERYPDPDSTYHIENAVVPGAARTKPFKEDGLDYGYAIGNIVYAPKKYLRFSMGNNHSFIGQGYRSLFLSDNSVPTTYFRTDMTLFKKLEYTIYRSKQFNLLRRPYRTTVEAYYEPKLFSSQFLHLRASQNLQLSIFEGSMWSLGDSVSYRPVDAAYFVPIPFVSNFLTSDQNLRNSLHGLQAEYSFKTLRFYSQLAIREWNMDYVAAQIGFRYYQAFSLKNSMFQLEYNNVPKNVYTSSNARINYAQYNLPFAHPKGEGFQEIIGRFTYTFKRIYVDLKTVSYQLRKYREGSLLVDNPNNNEVSGSILHQQTEIGYRFNQKVNLTAFVRHVHRSASYAGEPTNSFIMVGISTGIINHYNDF